MVANLTQDYLSPEDYLEGEKQNQIKHEYIDGRVYAMSGASDAHGLIAVNLVALLRPHLRGSGCLDYVGDMSILFNRVNDWNWQVLAFAGL